MSDKALRFLVASVIALLLIHQIGTLVAGLFGAVWGVISGIAVLAVSFLSAHMARKGGKGSHWFILPTLLFILLPVAYMIAFVMTTEVSWVARLMGLAPFALGFATPVLLLLLVYYELRKRAGNG